MNVHRLAIYGDRTGLIAQNAAKGARVLGIRKEQRGLDLLIGALSVAYKEKYLFDPKDMQIDPYQYSGASVATTTQLVCTTANSWGSDTLSNRPFPFENDVPNNPVSDYHCFEKADQYQSKLVDPNDGLPITFGNKPSLFACYTDRFNIALVLSAFAQWRISQATSALVTNSLMTQGPNVINQTLGELDVQTSRMLRQRMIASALYSEAGVGTPQADHVYFYGDIKEAIKYATNWNIKVIMAPANSEAEFNQDVVLRWRFDERGQWFWNEPRLMQRWNYQDSH
jgi:hypothetical protein